MIFISYRDNDNLSTVFSISFLVSLRVSVPYYGIEQGKWWKNEEHCIIDALKNLRFLLMSEKKETAYALGN